LKTKDSENAPTRESAAPLSLQQRGVLPRTVIIEFVWRLNRSLKWRFCRPACGTLYGTVPTDLLGKGSTQSLQPFLRRQWDQWNRRSSTSTICWTITGPNDYSRGPPGIVSIDDKGA